MLLVLCTRSILIRQRIKLLPRWPRSMQRASTSRYVLLYGRETAASSVTCAPPSFLPLSLELGGAGLAYIADCAFSCLHLYYTVASLMFVILVHSYMSGLVFFVCVCTLIDWPCFSCGHLYSDVTASAFLRFPRMQIRSSVTALLYLTLKCD